MDAGNGNPVFNAKGNRITAYHFSQNKMLRSGFEADLPRVCAVDLSDPVELAVATLKTQTKH
jgi:hypothetical protein